MFSENQKPTKPIPKPNPRIVNNVQQCYFAAEPNSRYNSKLFLYHKRKVNDEDSEFSKRKKDMLKDTIACNWTRHDTDLTFARILKEQVNEKMISYENKIDERRKKLKELLAKEERMNILEIIDKAQTACDSKTQTRINYVLAAKAKAEEEKLHFVQQMRLQQYLNRCTELRPVFTRQQEIETQRVQFIQREENNSRKEAEKELEKFWNELSLKQMKAMDDKEEQVKLKNLKQKREYLYYSSLQAHEREVLKKRKKEEILEEHKELEILRKQIEQEDLEEKRRKENHRIEASKQFNTYMKEKQELVKQEAEDEFKITRAYHELAEKEVLKEKETLKNNVSNAIQNMNLYKQYLENLHTQNRIQDEEKDKIIQNKILESYKKQDEEKLMEAKHNRLLLQACIETNTKMRENRRNQAEEERKQKEIERQFVEFTRKQNDQLKDEYTRQNLLKKKQYFTDLTKQIEYSNILKEREKENTKRLINAVKEEDKMYEEIVQKVLKGDIKMTENHPFKIKLIQEKCPCPKPSYKY